MLESQHGKDFSPTGARKILYNSLHEALQDALDTQQSKERRYEKFLTDPSSLTQKTREVAQRELSKLVTSLDELERITPPKKDGALSITDTPTDPVLAKKLDVMKGLLNPEQRRNADSAEALLTATQTDLKPLTPKTLQEAPSRFARTVSHGEVHVVELTQYTEGKLKGLYEARYLTKVGPNGEPMIKRLQPNELGNYFVLRDVVEELATKIRDKEQERAREAAMPQVGLVAASVKYLDQQILGLKQDLSARIRYEAQVALDQADRAKSQGRTGDAKRILNNLAEKLRTDNPSYGKDRLEPSNRALLLQEIERRLTGKAPAAPQNPADVRTLVIKGKPEPPRRQADGVNKREAASDGELSKVAEQLRKPDSQGRAPLLNEEERSFSDGKPRKILLIPPLDPATHPDLHYLNKLAFHLAKDGTELVISPSYAREHVALGLAESTSVAPDGTKKGAIVLSEFGLQERGWTTEKHEELHKFLDRLGREGKATLFNDWEIEYKPIQEKPRKSVFDLFTKPFRWAKTGLTEKPYQSFRNDEILTNLRDLQAALSQNTPYSHLTASAKGQILSDITRRSLENANHTLDSVSKLNSAFLDIGLVPDRPFTTAFRTPNSSITTTVVFEVRSDGKAEARVLNLDSLGAGTELRYDLGIIRLKDARVRTLADALTERANQTKAITESLQDKLHPVVESIAARTLLDPEFNAKMRKQIGSIMRDLSQPILDIQHGAGGKEVEEAISLNIQDPLKEKATQADALRARVEEMASKNASGEYELDMNKWLQFEVVDSQKSVAHATALMEDAERQYGDEFSRNGKQRELWIQLFLDLDHESSSLSWAQERMEAYQSDPNSSTSRGTRDFAESRLRLFLTDLKRVEVELAKLNAADNSRLPASDKQSVRDQNPIPLSAKPGESAPAANGRTYAAYREVLIKNIGGEPKYARLRDVASKVLADRESKGLTLPPASIDYVGRGFPDDLISSTPQARKIQGALKPVEGHGNVYTIDLPDGTHYFRSFAPSDAHSASFELAASDLARRLGIKTVPKAELVRVTKPDGGSVWGVLSKEAPGLDPADPIPRTEGAKAMFELMKRNAAAEGKPFPEIKTGVLPAVGTAARADLEAGEFLFGQTDGHMGNVKVTQDGAQVFDHNGAFATYVATDSSHPKTNTYIGGNLPDFYTEHFKAGVEALTDEVIDKNYSTLLAPARIEALKLRRDIILEDIRSRPEACCLNDNPKYSVKKTDGYWKIEGSPNVQGQVKFSVSDEGVHVQSIRGIKDQPGAGGFLLRELEKAYPNTPIISDLGGTNEQRMLRSVELLRYPRTFAEGVNDVPALSTGRPFKLYVERAPEGSTSEFNFKVVSLPATEGAPSEFLNRDEFFKTWDQLSAPARGPPVVYSAPVRECCKAIGDWQAKGMESNHGRLMPKVEPYVAGERNVTQTTPTPPGYKFELPSAIGLGIFQRIFSKISGEPRLLPESVSTPNSEPLRRMKEAKLSKPLGADLPAGQLPGDFVEMEPGGFSDVFLYDPRKGLPERQMRSEARYAIKARRSEVSLPEEIDGQADAVVWTYLNEKYAVQIPRDVVVQGKDAMIHWTAAHVAAESLGRDLAVYPVVTELAGKATLDGENFIEVAPIVSTAAEHAQGLVIQKAAHGHQVQDLQLSIDTLVDPVTHKIRPEPVNPKDPKELVQYRNSLNMLTDAGILKNGAISESDLPNIMKMQSRIGALQQFYQDTHFALLKFYDVNHLPPPTNYSEGYSGPRLKGLPSDQLLVGLDYNHGRNVIWDPVKQKFVIFDW